MGIRPPKGAKRLTLILAALLLTALVTGCGGGGAAAPTGTTGNTGGAGGVDPAKGSDWDQMAWDQGEWA